MRRARSRFGPAPAGWLVGVLVLAAATVAPPARAADFEATTLTDEDVRRAMDAIIGSLYAQKDPQQFWEPASIPTGESRTQQGGHTALVVLALIDAGQSYQDPRLRDAVAYLESVDMEGTYAAALRAHVWAMLPAKFRPRLEHDARFLMGSFHDESRCWYYTARLPRRYEDNSIRQYGGLGLWEAAKRGVPVETRFWQMLEGAFLDGQHADGSWGYQPGEPGTGSMTAAGLAILFITQDYLHAEESVRLEAPRDTRAALAIERGLAWLGEHFSATENPGRDTYFYYYLYGIERVGLASGYRAFGGNDWFREGAAELLNRLVRKDPATGAMSVHERTYGRGNTSRIKPRELAFALLFLNRGRVPVAVNKLRVDGAAWNNRPRDVANLTEHLRVQLESRLNWQIVDIASEPAHWLDAPLLYLASHEALPWLREIDVDATTYRRDALAHRQARSTGARPADEAPPSLTGAGAGAILSLRSALDRGGMLLAVNEGRSEAFARSVETLGSLLYPHLEWRTLPEDHWAYTIHGSMRGRRPTLRGLSNGVRELIILVPTADWPASFQGRAERPAEPWQVATNVYLYASEMNRPRPRLARHADAPAPPAGVSPGPTIVRAMYDGSWDAEPQALGVWQSALAAERGWSVRVVDHSLAQLTSLDPAPALTIVSGIDAHEFTPAEIESIRSCAEAGGVILFETTGGRGAFAAGAEKMATTIFESPVRSVLRTPVISGEGIEGAARLTRVAYRPYALERFGVRDVAPRLRGMQVDGEVRLLFSHEDLSHALLGQPCWGVSGYSTASARDLAANILLYATSRPRGAAGPSGPSP